MYLSDGLARQALFLALLWSVSFFRDFCDFALVGSESSEVVYPFVSGGFGSMIAWKRQRVESVQDWFS